jgi:hypothetical protein
MHLISKIVCFGLVVFQFEVLARPKIEHDLNTETRLLEQLASTDSETKLNAAVEMGNVFRKQQGLHPQVYSKLLKMLAPESSHTEREGAAWALGEMRYVDPVTRRLMKQYEVEATESGDISLATVLMHSLREIADVPPDSKKRKCEGLFKSLR